MDNSDARLEICREKLRERPALSGRAAVDLGDITNSDLGTAFDLIIAPYRVMQNLETDDSWPWIGSSRHRGPGANA